jgi:hypothetical protein
MKILSSFVLTAGLIFGSVANANIMVWLDPGNQSSSGAGDDVSVTLMVSGLGDGIPDSLGAFDLDINFDPNVLSFDSYSLFDGLGDVDLFEAFDDSSGDDGFGTINLALISFLFDFELDALQSDMFALAELFFTVDALASGETTALSLNVLDFSDAFGSSFIVDVGNDATISVNQVSAPAPQLLLGLALLSLFVRRTTFQLFKQ